MTYTKDIHAHELDVGARFGNYRVIQCSQREVHAEDIKTGEVTRFIYSGDNLVKTRHY